MSQFETLMATLNAIDAEPVEEMAKALPAEAGDEKKVQNAAAAAKPETEAESDYEKEEEETDEEGESLEKGAACGDMKKSFVSEEGEELIDATEILTDLQKSFASHDDILAKALPKVVELLGSQSKQLKEQGDLIKSLQQTITGLSGRGTGRKSTVTVLAKSQVSTEAAAQQEQPVTKEDIMAKAFTLFDNKKLSSMQVNMLDVALRNGYAPDADTLAVIARN